MAVLYPTQKPVSFSVGDLIVQCREAAGRMGIDNPHRQLMLLSATALSQLSHRLSQYEAPDNPDPHETAH